MTLTECYSCTLNSDLSSDPQSAGSEPATTPGSPNAKPLPPVPEGESEEYIEVTAGQLNYSNDVIDKSKKIC